MGYTIPGFESLSLRHLFPIIISKPKITAFLRAQTSLSGESGMRTPMLTSDLIFTQINTEAAGFEKSSRKLLFREQAQSAAQPAVGGFRPGGAEQSLFFRHLFPKIR